MSGINAHTGEAISGIEHVKQSICDILLTPVGSRVMRRSYGSRVMYLLDQPMNEALVAAIQGAVAEALTQHEPRIKLTQVRVNSLSPGELNLMIEGFYVPDSRVIRLENIAIK